MKPIYSMTGYAVEKYPFAEGEITCELRALNSRYLEIYFKLPQQLRNYEDQFKNTIRQRIDRAKLNCVISLSENESLPEMLTVNKATAEMYKRLLEELRAAANIQEPPTLSDYLQFKDLFTIKETTADETFLHFIEEALLKTIDRLNAARAEEGENLRKDLLQRLERISSLGAEIKEFGVNNARMEFQKQMERLQMLVDESKLDRNRLEMEVALISDRVDISEEIVRLNSHIELFRDSLSNGSPVGKKLNFILQEMHREANTMSSKNTMIEISHRIVVIKEEVERMREQVQNIE